MARPLHADVLSGVISATPLGPWMKAIGALAGLIKPTRSFLSGFQTGLARRTGKPLKPREIAAIWGGGKKSKRHLAKLLAERPELVPLTSGEEGDVANLFSASGGFNDPFADLTSGGGALGGLAGALGGIASVLPSVLAQREQTKQLKALAKLVGGRTLGAGSAFVAPSANPAVVSQGFGPLAGILAGAAAGGLGSVLAGLGPDLLPGGLEESGTGFFGPDLFAPTAASARQRMIDAPHPTSGERVYWRPVGRPILFAGDLSLLRMTRKKLRRFAGPAGLVSGRLVPGRRGVRRR